MTLTRPDLRTLTFLALAGTVYVFALSIRPLLPALDRGAAVSMGLTLDLSLVVPGCFYFLVARPRRKTFMAVTPLVVLGLATAHFVVPAEHRSPRDLLVILPLVLELVLLSWIGVRVTAALRQGRAGRENADARQTIRRVTEAVVGRGALAEALAFEIAVLYYGLLAWRTPVPDTDGERFTGYRRNGYTHLVMGLLMAMACEAFVVHLLVQKYWNGRAAWTLTAIGVYGMVWFFGDWQAARRRHVELTPRTLELRVGLRWDLSVPYTQVKSLRRLKGIPTKGSGLNVSILGAPSFELELTEPVEAAGVYGRRRRTAKVRFQVDEPDALESRLRGRLSEIKN